MLSVLARQGEVGMELDPKQRTQLATILSSVAIGIAGIALIVLLWLAFPH